MREPFGDEAPPTADRGNDWGVAVVIALSIFICLATFIWIFVALEPFMNDFTGTDVIVTPDPSDPLRTPVEGTESIDAGDTRDP